MLAKTYTMKNYTTVYSEDGFNEIKRFFIENTTNRRECSLLWDTIQNFQPAALYYTYEEGYCGWDRLHHAEANYGVEGRKDLCFSILPENLFKM
jgi:hypothetical protein